MSELIFHPIAVSLAVVLGLLTITAGLARWQDKQRKPFDPWRK